MPVPQPDEVMELAFELKKARDKVAELESRWQDFFTHSTVIQTPLNLKPRIVQHLEARPDQEFTMATVAAALGAKENSVGPYLSELAKDGKIERRGRGMYGALRPDNPMAIFVNLTEARREQEESPAIS